MLNRLSLSDDEFQTSIGNFSVVLLYIENIKPELINALNEEEAKKLQAIIDQVKKDYAALSKLDQSINEESLEKTTEKLIGLKKICEEILNQSSIMDKLIALPKSPLYPDSMLMTKEVLEKINQTLMLSLQSKELSPSVYFIPTILDQLILNFTDLNDIETLLFDQIGHALSSLSSIPKNDLDNSSLLINDLIKDLKFISSFCPSFIDKDSLDFETQQHYYNKCKELLKRLNTLYMLLNPEQTKIIAHLEETLEELIAFIEESNANALPQYEEAIQNLFDNYQIELSMTDNLVNPKAILITLPSNYKAIGAELLKIPGAQCDFDQISIPLNQFHLLHETFYRGGLIFDLEKYIDKNQIDDFFKDAMIALTDKETTKKLTPLNRYLLQKNSIDSKAVNDLLHRYRDEKTCNAIYNKYKKALECSFSELSAEEKTAYLNYQFKVKNPVNLKRKLLYNIIFEFDSFLKIQQDFAKEAQSIITKLTLIKNKAEQKDKSSYFELISKIGELISFHELSTDSQTLNFKTQKNYYLGCKEIVKLLPTLYAALDKISPQTQINELAVFIGKLKALIDFYEKCNAMPKKDLNTLPNNTAFENIKKLKARMAKDLKDKDFADRSHPSIPIQHEYKKNPDLVPFKNALITTTIPRGEHNPQDINILSWAPGIKVEKSVAARDNQKKEQENYNKVIDKLKIAKEENNADIILLQKIPETLELQGNELGANWKMERSNEYNLLTYYDTDKFELLNTPEGFITENSGSVLSIRLRNKITLKTFDILNVCGLHSQDPKKTEREIKELANSSSEFSIIMGHINANMAPHDEEEENIINHASGTFPNGGFYTTDGGENFTQLKTQNLDVDTGSPVKDTNNMLFDPSYFPIMNLDKTAREALVIDNKSLIEYEKHIQALFNDPRIEFNMASTGSKEKAILIKLPNDDRYNALLKLINESGINCTNHDNSAHQIFVPLEQANLLHKQICINKSQESEKIAYLKSQVLTQFKIDNTYIKENQSDVSSSFSHTKHISVKRILSIETHSYEDYRKLLQLELEALNEKNTTISRVLKHCLLLDKNPPSTPKKTRIVTLTSNASLEVLKYIDSKEKSLPYRLFSSDSDQSSAELKLAGKLAHDLAKCKDSKSLVNFTLKISKLLSQGKITPDSDLANIFYDLMKNARQYIMEYNDVLLRETRKTKNKTILQDIQVEGGDLLNTYLVKQENSWFKEANFNQIFDAILLLNRLLNCKAEDLKSVYVDLCVCKSDSEKSPKLDSVYSKIITNIENKLRKDGLERSCVAWKKTAGEAIAIRNPEKSSLRL